MADHEMSVREGAMTGARFAAARPLARRCGIALAASCLVFPALACAASASLIPGGDFEAADASGWVQGWYRVPGGEVARADENGNHFVRFKVAKPESSSLMQHELPRDRAWKAMKLSARIRYSDVRRGKKGWNDARVQLIFLDEKNKPIGLPAALHWTGSSKEWQQQEESCLVPDSAVKVKVQVGLFDAAAGQLDIDDLQLTEIDPSAVSGAAAEATVGDKPGDAAAPKPAPMAAAPTTQPLPYDALASSFKGAKVEGKMAGGWYVLNGAPEIVEEKDNAFLRLKATDAQRTVQVRRVVPLHPDWGELTLSAHLRHQNVKHGEKNWQNARLIVEFLDAQGKRLSAPAAMDWKGSSKGGWIDESQKYVIPMGAAQLKLDPALLEVESGTLDIESLTVTITKSRADQAAAGLLPEAWKPALVPHWREKTATRDTICLNGVWQLRPIGVAPGDPKQVTAGMIQTPPLPAPLPAGVDWGYGKVPSTFPGSKENAHEWALPPAWSAVGWAGVDAVWFRRSIDVPAEWADKRIVLSADSVQSQAAVFVGDKLVGRIVYPAGSLDISSAVTPGSAATLTLLVIAKPFQEQRVHAMNPNEVYLESAELKQRGLCGDVLLRAEPRGVRVEDVQLRPSVRQKNLGLALQTAGAAGKSVRVRFTASEGGQEEFAWKSDSIAVGADGRVLCSVPWQARHLWDLDSPSLYEARVAICDEAGKVLDEVQQRLGFRELWLDGRDIILNGSPIHWRSSKIGSNLAGRSKPQMAATFQRMRELGFNSAILDYDVNPGSAPAYTPMYEAADEAGFILVATIPSLIPWKADTLPTDEARKAWQELAGYCIRQAQDHPSVFAYSTNHNRLGYIGGSNPEKFDGRHEPASPDPVFGQKRQLAAEAERYIRAADPTREVYHHSANNFGAWETNNCYLNWMPLQERRDYLSHWAEAGAKPLFLTEFGIPFVASWGRYKGPGVYRPTADSEPLFVEYSAALNGARAYEVNVAHEQYLDQYEAAYTKAGRSNWGVLTFLLRRSTEWNYVEVQSRHVLETFPAMRTWGISALLPWDWKGIANWTEKTPAKVSLTEPVEQWTMPGIHPDFAPGFGYSTEETWFSSPAADTYKLTSLAEAYRKVNREVLAWIAGRSEKFTEQTHVFEPGQKVSKQVIVINDLRRELKAHYELTVQVGDRKLLALGKDVSVPPGRQQREPVEFSIPEGVSGDGVIRLTLALPGGTKQEDELAFRVLPAAAAVATPARMAMWDPSGDSAPTLKRLGLALPAVAQNVPDEVRCLVIGRNALTVGGAAPDIRALLARGGRVVVFEQSGAVLSQRLGFRTATPSLRNVYVRAAGHPLLDGLDDSTLHDWNGEATLTAGKLPGLPEFEAKYPAVDWLGFRNTRVWKWGNWGQVSSVVIEKPQTGDFLPIVDGGFDLQYAPLLLTRQGGGEILFCQLDLTQRSEPDPVADRLLRNIVRWGASAPASPAAVPARYVGEASAQQFLASLGAELQAASLPTEPQTTANTWIIGPDVTAGQLKAALPVIEKSHGTFVFLFPIADTLAALSAQVKVAPVKVIGDSLPTDAPAEVIAAGVGPSELHLRGRTSLLGVIPASGWNTTAGTLATCSYGSAKLAFLQIDPRQFDYKAAGHSYLKLTHNHTRTLLSRVLSNAGVPMSSPLVDYWSRSSSQAALDLARLKWQAAVEPAGKLTPEQAASGGGLEWHEVTVPGALDQRAEWATVQGRFWYRLSFDVAPELLDEDLMLTCGVVDDEDSTYLNGKLLGHIGKDTHPQDYYRQLRQYKIPKSLLKAKGNVLIIQGVNIEGPGGILEGPVRIGRVKERWQASYYQDTPVATDDPYRYYRW